MAETVQTETTDQEDPDSAIRTQMESKTPPVTKTTIEDASEANGEMHQTRKTITMATSMRIRLENLSLPLALMLPLDLQEETPLN